MNIQYNRRRSLIEFINTCALWWCWRRPITLYISTCAPAIQLYFLNSLPVIWSESVFLDFKMKTIIVALIFVGLAASQTAVLQEKGTFVWWIFSVFFCIFLEKKNVVFQLKKSLTFNFSAHTQTINFYQFTNQFSNAHLLGNYYTILDSGLQSWKGFVDGGGKHDVDIWIQTCNEQKSLIGSGNMAAVA